MVKFTIKYQNQQGSNTVSDNLRIKLELKIIFKQEN